MLTCDANEAAAELAVDGMDAHYAVIVIFRGVEARVAVTEPAAHRPATRAGPRPPE
jgi:hypothetical protein